MVTRKRRRLYVVMLRMLTLSVAAALVLTAFEDNIVYFHSPTDIKTKDLPKGHRFRAGGLVVADSIVREADGVTIRFGLTDLQNTITVAYRGVLPDLFREGQGAVVEGMLDADGVFRAEEVLAKHDETYMPKEIADALKKSGKWKGSP